MKILDALPKSWQKTLVGEESKDLKTLPLEEKIGSFLTYETKLNRLNGNGDNEKVRKRNALKAIEPQVMMNDLLLEKMKMMKTIWL